MAVAVLSHPAAGQSAIIICDQPAPDLNYVPWAKKTGHPNSMCMMVSTTSLGLVYLSYLACSLYLRFCHPWPSLSIWSPLFLDDRFQELYEALMSFSKQGPLIYRPIPSQMRCCWKNQSSGSSHGYPSLGVFLILPVNDGFNPLGILLGLFCNSLRRSLLRDLTMLILVFRKHDPGLNNVVGWFSSGLGLSIG